MRPLEKLTVKLNIEHVSSPGLVNIVLSFVNVHTTEGGCGSSRLTLRFFKEETAQASLVLSGFVLLGNGLDSLMQF